MDVDSIDLGVDFVQKIEEHLARCSVVLVVIGQDWLSVTDPRGRRRLDDPNGFVRLEVEAALRSSARVIPVLVEGATMPDPDELPASMAALVRRNGLVVSMRGSARMSRGWSGRCARSCGAEHRTDQLSRSASHFCTSSSSAAVTDHSAVSVG